MTSSFILDTDGSIFGLYAGGCHWCLIQDEKDLAACKPVPAYHIWRKASDTPLTREQVRAILIARGL